MKYVYDILINLNDKLLEFYEWDDDDGIDYIRKIPSLKVGDTTLNDIKNNKIKINEDFLKKMHYSELYEGKKIKKVNNLVLFVSPNDVVVILFDNNGISIKKSDLLIEESLDIIRLSSRLKVLDISYEVLKNEYKELFTRKEERIVKYMKEEINNIYKNNTKKLMYIYYEYSGVKENNINKVYKELYSSINEASLKLYNVLNNINRFTNI